MWSQRQAEVLSFGSIASQQIDLILGKYLHHLILGEYPHPVDKQLLVTEDGFILNSLSELCG